MPSLPALPHAPTVPSLAVAQKWGRAHATELLGAAFVVVIGYYSVLIVRRFRRLQGGVAPLAEKKWDGTVQVVLPVPKR